MRTRIKVKKRCMGFCLCECEEQNHDQFERGESLSGRLESPDFQQQDLLGKFNRIVKNWDSGDDDAHGIYVYYKDRPEWQDVKPVPSNEGPIPVVSIDYSEQFADVYDYVRGVIKTGELTRRVLSLTCDAISLNAANYTVWQLRRDVLEALGVPKVINDHGLDSDFDREFAFCERMIESNQKNYQVWHHQKALVTWAMGYDEIAKTMKVTSEEHQQIIFKRELNLTKHILSFDAKNYHAWQHRQWILSVFREFSSEMEYVISLLNDDVRNNSAWNQKHFVFVNLDNLSGENLMRELDETWNFIKIALSNESPWSYLRGLIKLAGDSKIILQKELVARCKGLMKQSDSNSVPMYGLYIETVDDLLKTGEGGLEEFTEILCMLENMIETIDPIRCNYWEYIKKKFTTTHASICSQKRKEAC